MTIKIANAPCSWGVDYFDDIKNPNWQKVFLEISQSGYSYSELGPFGYLPNDSKMVNEFLKQIDLKIIGGFIFDNLHDSSEHLIIKNKILNTCKLLKSLGSKFFVIIDHISFERMKTSGDQKNSSKLNKILHKDMTLFINEISNICFEEFGLIPVLHPHAGTYIEYEFEIDDLLNEIKSDYLGLCLDTAHLYYSSIDPYKAILKYASKIQHMHLKDINQKVLENVYNNNIDFDSAVNMQVFSPLGTGIIDFKKILDNLKLINYDGYATIEQDINPSEKLVPIEYAKKSLNYLNKILHSSL
tara:strand:+ start:353 stop:1252 length:900 start_codon:yes stop_codon:yes gene_type:complete